MLARRFPPYVTKRAFQAVCDTQMSRLSQYYQQTSEHNVIEPLTTLFERMKVSNPVSLPQSFAHQQKLRVSKGIYFQRRTYTVQAQRHTAVKPQKQMDWLHLDESGNIKKGILERRKLFLKKHGLLEDCFTYKNRTVFANKHLYDVTQKDTIGRTNLERMRKGYCPVDKTGQDIIIIHHFDQTMQGPWVILTNLFHQNESNQLHSFVILKDRVIREKFNYERKQYWKYLAAQLDLAQQIKQHTSPKI